jgi:hypothetical protein
MGTDGEVNPNMILRITDSAFIPNNPQNRDWIAYQEWLADGNTPLPPEGVGE